MQINLKETLAKLCKIHNNEYNYSQVKEILSNKKICIICKKHGKFYQSVYTHLRGAKCPKCELESRKIRYNISKEEFIEKAKKVHGNLYNYKKVNISKLKDRVCIICSKHGEFYQLARSHILGHGCPKCGHSKGRGKEVTDTKTFIAKCKIIHNNKYDYSKVLYTKRLEKVCIICPEHGEFYQLAGNHLTGQGCPICGRIQATKSLSFKYEEFIKRAKVIHNNKYKYQKVKISNFSLKNKICIICPEHGEFYQKASDHLHNKSGCPECAKLFLSKKYLIPKEEYIQRANLIHHNKYDYSFIKEGHRKWKIICPEHGKFYQDRWVHLSGGQCPKCRSSKISKPEKQIIELLETNNIEFCYQKQFPECRNILPLFFDFYIRGKRGWFIIEYNGIQHYKPVSIFGGKEDFKIRKKCDKLKINFCQKYNIPLYVIKYDQNIQKELNLILSRRRLIPSKNKRSQNEI